MIGPSVGAASLTTIFIQFRFAGDCAKKQAQRLKFCIKRCIHYIIIDRLMKKPGDHETGQFRPANDAGLFSFDQQETTICVKNTQG
jgi:hypothetical protein